MNKLTGRIEIDKSNLKVYLLLWLKFTDITQFVHLILRGENSMPAIYHFVPLVHSILPLHHSVQVLEIRL